MPWTDREPFGAVPEPFIVLRLVSVIELEFLWARHGHIGALPSPRSMDCGVQPRYAVGLDVRYAAHANRVAQISEVYSLTPEHHEGVLGGA